LTEQFDITGDVNLSSTTIATTTINDSLLVNASTTFTTTTAFSALVNFNGTFGGTALFTTLIDSTSTISEFTNNARTGLATTTIPANSLIDNNVVRGIYNLNWRTNGTERLTTRVFFGTTEIASSSILSSGAAFLRGQLEVTLIANTSASSQYSVTRLEVDGSFATFPASAVNMASTNLTAALYSTSTTAVDATVAQDLAVEFEVLAGGSNSRVTLEGWTVEILAK